jgi:hypothetical protein
MKSEIINALQCKFPPQDPTTREMAKTRHYSKACWGGIVPAGVTGKFLWELGERLKPEYRKLHNTDPSVEVSKIASFVINKK